MHPQLAIMDPISGGIIGAALVSMGSTVRNLVEKAAGPAADEVGEWLRDKIHDFRRSNTTRVFEKAGERLTLRDIEPQEVPLSVLFPLLEAASLEDDAEMQEYWATLLANAASGISIPPTFTRLLQALRPLDAKVLDACAQLDDTARHRVMPATPLDRGGYVVGRRDVKNLVGIQSWTELELCVDTLTSLRLIEPTPAIYPLEWESGEDADLPLRVTPLGRAFFAAVNPKLAEQRDVEVRDGEIDVQPPAAGA